LNVLEKKLAAAEKEFGDANLDQRMEELKTLKNQQVRVALSWCVAIIKICYFPDSVDEGLWGRGDQTERRGSEH